MAFVTDFLENIFLVLPANIAIFYFLGLILSSITLFIAWGSKIYDILWKQLKIYTVSKREQKM